MIFLKTSKAEKLRGYFIKINDFAAFYASHPEVFNNANLTRYQPLTYILKSTQWIPINEISKFIDPKFHKEFYNNVKIYVLKEIYKTPPYFYFNNIELISKYLNF